ncbi:hypothetical protein M3Y99_00890800 [Aphelenchoides fujianensis]|nr:hypothetical protein M3Y99_00890800 [Aphelenchoides fujianensis]
MRGPNLKLYVEPTDVSFEWIVQQLNGKDRRWTKLKKNHKIIKVEYKAVPGYGFFTHAEQMAEGLVAYHNQEIRFYQTVGSRYTSFILPKLYGFEESDPTTGRHGRLLIEDISERGRQVTAIHGLKIAQCCAVVEAIAQFHAFTRYVPNSEAIMSSMDGNHLLDLSDDQIQLTTRLSVLHEEYFKKNADALRALFQSAHRQPESPHLRFGVKPVLTHGDLTSANIFFHSDPKGRASNSVFTFIDFQTCALGNGASDLARFILTSTSAQVQQMCTDRFLKLYYETLRTELKRRGQEVDYSYKKLVEMFWEAYSYECIFALSSYATEAIKTRDVYAREKTIQRMIAAFEPIREKYEQLAAASSS